MLGRAEISQVQKTLRESISKKEIAGGNLLVLKDGNELLYHEDGFADLEAGLPVKRDSIFRLYSMSKPVTAAAVMILLERGEIDLYEPVSKYLPGFKNQKVEVGGSLFPAEREMNMKDLLSMTSGLVYGGANKAGQDTEALFQEIDSRLLSDDPMGTVEAMNRLGQGTLAFHPGASLAVRNFSRCTGCPCGSGSGMHFGEFLKK